jgi:hypothetical protein
MGHGDSGGGRLIDESPWNKLRCSHGIGKIVHASSWKWWTAAQPSSPAIASIADVDL